MEITIGNKYIFNHKKGNVLAKYDNTECKVINKDSSNTDMWIAEMNDGRKIQVYSIELTQ